MKSYIPHRILFINDQITKNIDDENFIFCMKLVFDWANKMGLEGKRVLNLKIEEPDYNTMPVTSPVGIWCQIECTLEERREWEKSQKIMVEIAVLDLLNSEEK